MVRISSDRANLTRKADNRLKKHVDNSITYEPFRSVFFVRLIKTNLIFIGLSFNSPLAWQIAHKNGNTLTFTFTKTCVTPHYT